MENLSCIVIKNRLPCLSVQAENVQPMTVSFCCHLDDRRGLFVRRDLAPLIFNSPRSLVEMTALMWLSVILTLCPVKIGWPLSLTVTLIARLNDLVGQVVEG